MMPAECRRGSSPANPSKRATARVTNPLPAPTACPHCTSPVELVENSAIYGRNFGEWPWAYRCMGCDAYVGLHPFTAIPLGTLATAEIRDARKRAKAAFNPVWQGRGMSRSDAYAWLARALGIADVEQCHIGWFDVAQCHEVVRVVQARVAKLAKDANKALTATLARPAPSMSPHPEDLARWKLGFERYEKARKLNPAQWAALHKRNLAGEWFDGMVDALAPAVAAFEDTNPRTNHCAEPPAASSDSGRY